MDHTTMAHLLHGLMEKRAELEDLLSSPPSQPISRFDKLKNLAQNPYARAAFPGAAMGLGAGIAGNVLGEGSWYNPVLASIIGAAGGVGLQGAINKGLINQKYAPMAQNLYPAALGGAVLGSAISDEHPILGTLGGAAVGGGAKIGLDALLKRFGGLKR